MTPVLHFHMLTRRSRLGLMFSLGLVGLMVLSGQFDASWGRWIAYLATCAALVFAIHQFPGSSRVTLDADGILIRSPFWKQKLDWRNLHGFVLVNLSRDPSDTPDRCWIGYLVSEPQRQAMPDETLRIFEPLGCHGLLPKVADVEPQELVHLLNGVLRFQRAEKQASAS